MPKKVADLTGAELDYWVAKAQGVDPVWLPISRDEKVVIVPSFNFEAYRPSIWWQHGGQIIDQHKISINQDLDATCDADRRAFAHMPDKVWKGCFGATALEAAMRCYVASKFGEEVNDESI